MSLGSAVSDDGEPIDLDDAGLAIDPLAGGLRGVAPYGE